jgi:hypothetical protein
VTTFYNRTRRSSSIPRRLLRERAFHLLPVYYLGRMSKLGREAIDNSGSYALADHVYAGRPEGSFLIGKALDALFLRMPSARSFRARYEFARAELLRSVAERLRDRRSVTALAIPCGLARELFDVSSELESLPPVERALISLEGVDLDADLVSHLVTRARELDAPLRFRCADALSWEAYASAPYDVVVSLGFTEFLDDERARAFYHLVRESLAPGGVFLTTGLGRHPISDYLLRRVAELNATYRGPDELSALAAAAGLRPVRLAQDRRRLLTTLVAERA